MYFLYIAVQLFTFYGKHRPLLSCMFLTPFLKIDCKCMAVSLDSVLSRWSVYLLLCQEHIVAITIAL